MTAIEAIDQIRSEYQARYGTPVEERIETGRVRDFLLAMDEPADLAAREPAPPLFLLTLGRTRRPQPARGSVVNAGDDFEFLAPVRIGDLITTSRRVVSVEEKQGARGRMYLTKSDCTWKCGLKIPVASARPTARRPLS